MNITQKFNAAEMGLEVAIKGAGYLASKATMIARQKEWAANDEAKGFDFTSAPFWLIADDGGREPIWDRDDLEQWLFIEYKDEYGSVQWEGREIALTQQAYVRDVEYEYEARGIDANGIIYLIVWVTTDAWDESLAAYVDEDFDNAMIDVTDESNACDWDDPSDVTVIGQL